MCGCSTVQCVLQQRRHQAPTEDVARLWLLHGARRTRAQGACSSFLPPALGAKSVLANTDQAPALVVFCKRSRHQASTDGQASLRLLHGARWTRTQGAFARLCRRHSGWSSACQHRPDTCNVFCKRSRLLEEQVCGCSTVRGGQGLKVRVLVSVAGTRME